MSLEKMPSEITTGIRISGSCAKKYSPNSLFMDFLCSAFTEPVVEKSLGPLLCGSLSVVSSFMNIDSIKFSCSLSSA